MIFEQIDSVTTKKYKTKQDWIQIGVDYLFHKDKGWTQKEYAKEAEIPLSTLEKRLRAYRNDILDAYEVAKTKKRPKKAGSSKRDIINQFRELLRTRAKVGQRAASRKSEEWFNKTVKEAMRTRNTSRPIPGRIYAYAYDAKYKNELPYWDMFPLIIYLGTRTFENSTVMLGLNLHYIAPKARQEFLEELLVNYSTTKNINSRTKVNINWNMVKSMSGSKAMIKAYLPKNIKGQMKEISPKDWPTAIYLPTYKFVSKGKTYNSTSVWSKR